MIQNSTNILWILLLLLAMSISACRKYEDGPTLSFQSRETRVENVWTAQSLFRNDLEETGKFIDFTMTFAQNGTFTWAYTPEIGDPVSIGAQWELTSLDRQIKLTFDEKDPTSGETRLLYMDIRRLTGTELWLDYLFEGDYYDLKLKD